MLSSSKYQKGVVHFGIIALGFLALAALVGSSVVSDLRQNFDIREEAAKPQTQKDCSGCAGKNQEWFWSSKNAECKKRVNKECGNDEKSAGETCPGVCEIGSCTEGRISWKGSCNKRGSICCHKPGGTSTGSSTASSEEQEEQSNPCKVWRDGECKNSGLPNCKVSLDQCRIGETLEGNSGATGGTHSGFEVTEESNNQSSDNSTNTSVCTIGDTRKIACKTSQNCNGKKTQHCVNGDEWVTLGTCEDTPNDSCPNKCPGGKTLYCADVGIINKCDPSTGKSTRAAGCPLTQICREFGSIAKCVDK